MSSFRFSNTARPLFKSEIDASLDLGRSSPSVRSAGRAFEAMIMDVLPQFGIRVDLARREASSKSPTAGPTLKK